MRRLKFFLAGIVGCVGAIDGFSKVELAAYFGDGMVLQRGEPITVWGRADVGERVQVEWRREKREVTATRGGAWQVVFAAEEANATPTELVVTGENRVVVADVLVGDVWLCSGQSNMEWRVRLAGNAKAEIAAAQYPLIRQFKVPLMVSDYPWEGGAGVWTKCSPATVGEFSAVGYYFAREVVQATGVPVGILNSSWGGTQIEGWISLPALRASRAAAPVLARWEEQLATFPSRLAEFWQLADAWRAREAAAKAAGRAFDEQGPRAPEGPGSRMMPAAMFNAMIHPYRWVKLRGVLWYQGEANVGRHDEYAELFPAMIEDWRRTFRQPDLPFYFVQLANFVGARAHREHDLWADLREAQTAALRLPQTEMISAIDIGESNNIHPSNKQEVGRRLARHALKQVYGKELGLVHGPRFAAAKRDGQEVRVTFAYAEGLRTTDGEAPLSFELAGRDGKFVAARASIDGDGIRVVAKSVSEPAFVRYAWKNDPKVNTVNAAGLPLEPFRAEIL